MRTLLLFTASALALPLANADVLPFRPATKMEALSLTQPSVIATPLNQTSFTTGAHVTVRKLSGATASNAQRGNQARSAVYKAAISAGTDPNPHPVPPEVQWNDLVHYEENHDSVQSWATMSEFGAPFVMIYADGQTQGSATASWSTRYAVQGTGTRDVYVRFNVPVVNMDGRFEDAQPSLTWARMRVDFLVNAYPAWSTETTRFNATHVVPPANYVHEKAVYFETFGSDLGLSAASKTSEAKTITLKLGTYPAGKAFDLTLLFQVEGKVASECGPDGDEIVCGNVTAKISWDPSAPQPTFYSRPAP